MNEKSSLYFQSLNTFVNNLNQNVVTLDRINYLRLLPSNVLADIYVEMCSTEPLREILMEELSDLNVFLKLLKFGTARQMMFRCFQALMSNGKPIAYELTRKFIQQTQHNYLLQNIYDAKRNTDNYDNMKTEILKQIDSGMRLGTFLSEAGWLDDCLRVLNTVYILIDQLELNSSNMLLQLNCLQRLLQAQAIFCCYKEASNSSVLAINIIDKINQLQQNSVSNCLLANIYQQISVLHFFRTEYDLSYSWSIKALQHIKKDMPDRIIIDVFRQAAKSCVAKRQFQSANLLIQQAVRRARIAFGVHHQKYADALLDYGFFLLNVDSISRCVAVYKEALEIKKNVFGNRNLHVAIAHEDLAYALYVLEYSTGRFDSAQEHVEKAIDIMKDIVPNNQLMLASAKRVKALILEEIALDHMSSTSNTDFAGLLRQSEELHQSALKLALEAFGEINVLTAKHYGNLGRLYQSMTKYDDAEQMHKRAIKIKTDLLGPYDYEVGLSIGHLASLYNYHMQKHRKAELLYLRSIDISLRLYGETYSGLEYDYRGLCHVYEATNNIDKYLQYVQILEEWRVLRSENEEGRLPMFVELKEDTSMDEVTRKFFEMCSDADLISVS